MPENAELHFQRLAEHSVDMLCRVSLDHTMQYVSPSCRRILGWTPEEMVGLGPEGFVLAEDLPIIIAASQRILLPTVENSPATVRMRRKDGAFIWMEMNARLVRDPETGEPREVVIVMRDIDERKRLEEELRSLALSDGLTGLANRRAFDQALEREWELTRQTASEISLLLVDIDHFKQVNDRYGHQAGDDCLRAIAAELRKSIRSTDLAARYGGDEIAVILRPTSAADARTIAEKLRAGIESLRLPPGECDQDSRWITASIGVATALARQGGSMRMPESLLMAADHALYQAKHAGRNRVATALLVAPLD